MGTPVDGAIDADVAGAVDAGGGVMSCTLDGNGADAASHAATSATATSRTAAVRARAEVRHTAAMLRTSAATRRAVSSPASMALELPADRPPLPPLELIDRVTRPFAAADADYVREGFDSYPRGQLAAFERALGLVGRSFVDAACVLDFGCGPGRFLRHLGPLAATTEVHGADVDADAIEWLQANLNYGHYAVLPRVPPSGYRAGQFDLVLAHSVFTHLDAAQQDAWLGELMRITMPGAIVLATVHSTGEWRQALHDLRGGGEDDTAWRTTYGRDGIVHVRDDHFIGSAHEDDYHTTFHAPSYILEHWSQWFDVVAYLPLGADVQDLVVLRRAADVAPVDPGPATPAAEPAEVTTETALAARIAALGDLLAAPTDRSWRDRLVALLRGRAERAALDAALATVLDDIAAALAARDRELAMLRVGMYEQGRRITLVARQLRDDLDAAVLGRGEHAD